MDWKDQLKAFAESDPALDPASIPAVNAEEPATEAKAPRHHLGRKLSFFTERKGRKGKTATIIAGFECDDDTLRETLKTLQRQLGTGGSARGGEILLQGEWAEQARAILEKING